MVLLAIGLVLILEGLVYALAPSAIEDMLALLRSMPLNMRRNFGLAAMAFGIVLVWIAKGLAA